MIDLASLRDDAVLYRDDELIVVNKPRGWAASELVQKLTVRAQDTWTIVGNVPDPVEGPVVLAVRPTLRPTSLCWDLESGSENERPRRARQHRRGRAPSEHGTSRHVRVQRITQDQVWALVAEPQSVARFSLTHPTTGRTLRFERPRPWWLKAWLNHTDHVETASLDDVHSAIIDASVLRRPLIQKGLSTYRLLHGEGEGIRGLDVEVYASYAVVWIAEEADELKRRAIAALVYDILKPQGLYLKVRPRQASRLTEAERHQLAGHEPAFGSAAPTPLHVHEGDIGYEVDLGSGLSTGLFLDQRENRRWLRSQCEGKRVLNLFSYTCSFSVAAARGGAAKITSVDVAAKVLETGKRNMELNGVDPIAHDWVADDVIPWLRRAAKRSERFDIIILDPPSFSTTRHGRFQVASDYENLACTCFQVMADRGRLLACTNHRTTTNERLRSWIHNAAKSANRGSIILETRPEAPDFPRSPTGPHMKAVACMTERR